MESQKKNADELLKVVKQRENSLKNGRLKVFLGMCPGVGKTFAMLQRAHLLAQKGHRVVVGVVETHSRAETANLVEGLEVVPLLEVPYRGTILKEMDLDKLLNMKPDYVLVDELAHSNASGSRHRKRWQDVEELLSVGINVLTTVNIQHIESRASIVEQIAGVAIQETVPDRILEGADELQLIDISVDELMSRLQDGKVYLGDRAERAKGGFFKHEILLALREIALRFMAEKVDIDLKSEMTIKGIDKIWETKEKFLVAISHSPTSIQLIRSAKKLSSISNARWVALHVDNGLPLEEADRKQLKHNIELAKELGAEFFSVTDVDLVLAIEQTCRDKQITQIVLGRSSGFSYFKRLFSPDLIDRLMLNNKDVDLHIIRYQPGVLQWRTPQFLGYLKNPNYIDYYYSLLLTLLGSFLCYAGFSFLGYQTLGFCFLIIIMIIAVMTSLGPVLMAAALMSLIWNYFFIPPRFTFNVAKEEDFMMLLSFFVTAFVSGVLATKVKQRDKLLRLRESRTIKLYELTKALSSATTFEEAKVVLIKALESELAGSVAVYFSNNQNDSELAFEDKYGFGAKEQAVAEWTFAQKKEAGWGTSTLSASAIRTFPVVVSERSLGVVLYKPFRRGKYLTIDQENFSRSVISQFSQFVNSYRSREAEQKQKLLETSEQLSQIMLNSVSHEMKTPLTTIQGIVSALRQMQSDRSDLELHLMSDLQKSATRLNRVVNNLLDVSRLESGKLHVKKEWFNFLDLKETIVFHLADQELSSRIVWPTDELYFEGDFTLIAHAIENLLSNAERHGTKGTELILSIDSDAEWVYIMVTNSGPAIPDSIKDSIFDKFIQGPKAPTGGVGLGLSIVKSIVDVHQGHVRFENIENGVRFTVQIPNRQRPPFLENILKGGD